MGGPGGHSDVGFRGACFTPLLAAVARAKSPRWQSAYDARNLDAGERGAHDDMHCHSGSEHTFLVWSGQLHIRGIEDGEDMTLEAGHFVQIKAGYYYQLHNPGPGRAVYCQIQTISPNPPKRGTVLFSESRRGKIAAEDVL